MPKSERTLRPPEGARTSGRRLWRAIVTKFELEEHELAMLRQAVRVVDVCDDLQAVVDLEGSLTTNRLGERKAHPALVELRQQRLVLARLLVALRVPTGEQEDEERPGRRSQRRGVRGFYAVGRSS